LPFHNIIPTAFRKILSDLLDTNKKSRASEPIGEIGSEARLFR